MNKVILTKNKSGPPNLQVIKSLEISDTGAWIVVDE